MNYQELQTAIIEDTHRPDLASLVPRFIRESEGLIRRDLSAYLLSATFGDTSRVTSNDGVYNLPLRTIDIRRIVPKSPENNRSFALDRVAVDAVRATAKVAGPLVYCQYGDGTIEIRGVPGEGSEFDILYFGTPAPLAGATDTNELLTDHESLYIEGAKFFVYLHTQDRELAQDSLNIFNGIIETLNEQVARQIGGAKVTQAYNFGHRSSY